MMMTEAERALFVRQQFRYATAQDNGIKAVNPQAREIQIDTSLDEAAATALAEKYLEANEKPRTFEIEIEGVMDLRSFIGGPPSFIPDLPEYHLTSGQLTMVSARVNYDTNTTTIQVRGA